MSNYDVDVRSHFHVLINDHLWAINDCVQRMFNMDDEDEVLVQLELNTKIRRIQVFASQVLEFREDTDEDDCVALSNQLDIVIALVSSRKVQQAKWFAVDIIKLALDNCTGAFVQN